MKAAPLGSFESPETSSGSSAVAASKGVPSMPATTSPLSGSILYQNERKTVDLLDGAAKEWAARAARGEQLNDETASLLAQMVRICLRAPDLMHDLWEWSKAEELATRLRDRQRAGEDLRERLEGWLQLLVLIQEAASRAEAAGYPVSGADKLADAADAMRSILQEVNETWLPREPRATPPLSYDELRSLADRFPPPAPWHEEKDDLF
jgi:hypothetical protein